jgi:acetyl esterase/lipase
VVIINTYGKHYLSLISILKIMKPKAILLILSFTFCFTLLNAQAPERIQKIFPEGTVYHQNIPYANDTLRKHQLDIYLPAQKQSPLPLVIWIHGGAWKENDKYADMGYMKNTLREFLENGYALASIDYRHSTTAIFPAQIQDCNQAIEFLYKNAATYSIDKNRFVLIGFSAGGHLASLLALSNNQTIPEFYAKSKPSFRIKAVLDFYGPSDFLLFFSNGSPTDSGDPISTLLGASPLKRPDISKLASPSSYVDKNDPPFFIVHGEKDESVPLAQSYLLQSLLEIAKVKNELTIVKDAPHYGEMFDTEDIRKKLFAFLKEYSK